MWLAPPPPPRACLNPALGTRLIGGGACGCPHPRPHLSATVRVAACGYSTPAYRLPPPPRAGSNPVLGIGGDCACGCPHPHPHLSTPTYRRRSSPALGTRLSAAVYAPTPTYRRLFMRLLGGGCPPRLAATVRVAACGYSTPAYRLPPPFGGDCACGCVRLLHPRLSAAPTPTYRRRCMPPPPPPRAGSSPVLGTRLSAAVYAPTPTYPPPLIGGGACPHPHPHVQVQVPCWASAATVHAAAHPHPHLSAATVRPPPPPRAGSNPVLGIGGGCPPRLAATVRVAACGYSTPAYRLPPPPLIGGGGASPHPCVHV